MEEADSTSQETLDVLGPTLRGVEGAELWAIWNPASSNDPMSKEFIEAEKQVEREPVEWPEQRPQTTVYKASPPPCSH